MQFTYDGYTSLICLLREHGYEVADYLDWKKKDKCVILRHDIDMDIGKSVELAKLERELGVKSTYFVLLTGRLYNVFSRESCEGLKKLIEYGHTIGLHFDETVYPETAGHIEGIKEKILQELNLLETLERIWGFEGKVTAVSMHRPGKHILESDLQIPGIVNSYEKTFFKGNTA